MQVYKIDKDGFYIEPVIIDPENDNIPEDCVKEQPPQGLYRARWTKTGWVESKPKQKIEAEKAARQAAELEKQERRTRIREGLSTARTNTELRSLLRDMAVELGIVEA